MADGISFPKKYLDFVCEPYKSSYASYLNAFQLIRIKDNHRDVLYADEVSAINNICNLVSHNIKELKRE
jgi:hypothetical protein